MKIMNAGRIHFDISLFFFFFSFLIFYSSLRLFLSPFSFFFPGFVSLSTSYFTCFVFIFNICLNFYGIVDDWKAVELLRKDSLRSLFHLVYFVRLSLYLFFIYSFQFSMVRHRNVSRVTYIWASYIFYATEFE